jgi:nucleotide-binding universal stress UspA family protein
VLVVGAAEDLEDLAGPAGLAEAMSVYDEQVARQCMLSVCHLDPPLSTTASPCRQRAASGRALTARPRFPAASGLRPRRHGGSVGTRTEISVFADAAASTSGDASSVGEIVVGVDGSEASREALRWSAEEARLRRTTLRAVYAWVAPAVSVHGYVPPELLDPEPQRQAAQARLDGFVKEVVGEPPGMRVERVVVEGPAARVLVDAADGAALLVVGSRGHGGFAGLLLGSVSQQCAQHAPCPVIVRGDGRARGSP